MINYNFHTHHYRCKHAVGEIEEYIVQAIEKEVEFIGVSCHVPYPGNPITHDRMAYEEIDDYLSEITALKEKYKDKIKILTAFECEYHDHALNHYKDLKNKSDYLILAQHEVLDDNEEYIDVMKTDDVKISKGYLTQLRKGAETKLFDYIAHPDLFLGNSQLSDEDIKEITDGILQIARDNNMMIEYNGNGVRFDRYYPSKSFFEYINNHYNDVKILVNSDAHNPLEVHDKAVERAYRQAKELDLNIVKDGTEFIKTIKI